MTIRKYLAWFWPFPSWGWNALALVDKLKLIAFFIQAGAGVAMTAFAAYAMYVLAQLKAVWPVFYLGAMALILVGIVVTGLAGLLIKRSVEADVAGIIKLKTADSDTATAVAEGMRGIVDAANSSSIEGQK